MSAMDDNKLGPGEQIYQGTYVRMYGWFRERDARYRVHHTIRGDLLMVGLIGDDGVPSDHLMYLPTKSMIREGQPVRFAERWYRWKLICRRPETRDDRLD